MRRSWRVAIVALVLMSGFQLGAGGRSLAQGTGAEPTFVYGINAAIPNNFIGAFAPPSAGTIYLLANRTSVISPRITEVYFWPITNEYRANWSTLNEVVPGSLEISRGGEVIAELESTIYTIHFTQAGSSATAELFTGDDARAAHERFLARQEEFRQASFAYYDAQRQWLAEVADANARRQTGEAVEIPLEPEPPEPIGIFSNGLSEGFPIDLEPGNYRIRVRGPDGEVVPDSTRSLKVFAPRRTGVGYSIVPESRWTTPEQSNAASDVIFGEAGSNLYLEPHVTREYPARSWAGLQNPQRPERATGEWEWAPGEALREGRLEVIVDGEVVDSRKLTPYRVQQHPGRQLGYDVVEYDPQDESAPAEPDFWAHPIHLGQPGDAFELRLVAPDGAEMAGSARSVRVPSGRGMASLLLPSLAPLVAGALVIVRRQVRGRLPRNLSG